MSSVVQSAVETIRPLIEQMGHDLTVKLPPQPVVIEADLARLAQVFINLLNNSAKYTERGGHIRLTVELQGSDVVVAIKDTGIGIAADKLPTVFDLFSQVEGSLSHSQGGLGIGLSLVKRLAPSWAQDRDVKVTGRVVDADGHPVPGAKVGRMWRASVGLKQDSFAPVITDDDGRFAAKVDFFGRDAVLAAIDTGRTNGGTVIVPASGSQREVEIRLAPLARVHGKLESQDLGRPITWSNV